MFLCENMGVTKITGYFWKPVSLEVTTVMNNDLRTCTMLCKSLWWQWMALFLSFIQGTTGGILACSLHRVSTTARAFNMCTLVPQWKTAWVHSHTNFMPSSFAILLNQQQGYLDNIFMDRHLLHGSNLILLQRWNVSQKRQSTYIHPSSTAAYYSTICRMPHTFVTLHNKQSICINPAKQVTSVTCQLLLILVKLVLLPFLFVNCTSESQNIANSKSLSKYDR